MVVENILSRELKQIKFKKNILTESKNIIEARLKQLVNETDFENVDDIFIFRAALIQEIKILSENGLLNEQDFGSVSSGIKDILSSIGKAAWDTMFIGIYKGIAKDLGFDTDTFLFRVVVEGLQSMTWNDILKVIGGDCRVATVKLVESLVKGLSSHIGNKVMPGGAGYDIIRRTLMDQFFKSETINSTLEDAMAPYVCDYLKKWIKNAEDKGSKLKKKKQSKSDSGSSQSQPDVLGSAKKAIGL